MAEREVSVEFVFDRSAEQSLTHAYRILVPERRARSAAGMDSDDYRQPSTAGSRAANRPELVYIDESEDRPALGA